MGGHLELDPTEGNVCFGSALFGWAFSLRTFARKLCKHFHMEEKELMKKLWGDNYYDAKAKEWTTNEISKVDGHKLDRSFVSFILKPIMKLIHTIMDNKIEEVEKMCHDLHIELKQDEKSQTGKDLMKTILKKWIHAADALLEMIVHCLPSPVDA